MIKTAFVYLVALALVAPLAGCGGKPAEQTAGAAPGNSGAAVTVVTVPAVQRDMVVVLQAIGTVVPIASVDIKAQTTSTVTKLHVQEGQSVKAGALLVSLDARPDEANVAKLVAQMRKDEAALADAQRQLARAKDLEAKGFVSKGATDTNQALADGLAATVAADRAALDAATLALSYTRVVAPASGRLGAVNLAPGAAVQANVTPLVTLTQLDPINVAFSLPQRNLSALLAALSGGGKGASQGDKKGDNKGVPVSAKLPQDTGTLQGSLQFVDNAVDPATGTVKVKARFDNKDNKLWPGAFVNVSLQTESIKDAIVIPTAAIIQTARGAIVYTTAQGKAQSRPVQVLAMQGEEAAVSGVNAGDRVVLEGRQNLRPDAPVVEREAQKAP